MSTLYEWIKNDLLELKEIRKREKEDFHKAKSFPQSFKENILRQRVNNLINIVNRKLKSKLGSDGFSKLITETYSNIGNSNSIKRVDYAYNYQLNPILDYEKIFDLVETKLSKEDINEIEKDFNANKKILPDYNKPLDPYVRAIIIDMDEMKDLTLEEKTLYKKYLNYIKDEIVEKDNNFVEGCIEEVSQMRTVIASEKLGEWAKKNNMDPKIVVALDTNHEHTTVVGNTTKIENEIFKPTLDLKLKYSDEFKQKILDLKSFLETKSVMQNSQAGESGGKEYAFANYFIQAVKINKLIDKQVTLTDEKEKKENLVKICDEAVKFEKINKEYDEILAYIKEKFDLNDVALCGNIYSGRKTSFEGDLSRFKPTIPERWDNENAPYGVILNGFVQFQTMADICGVTFDEMFDKPIESFLAGAKKTLDKSTEEAVPRVGEANLGMRIAKTLAPLSNTFNPNAGYNYLSRGLEFLYNQCEENEQAYDNISLTHIATTYCNKFAVNEIVLFGGGNRDVDYNSLKNLFAFGDEVDNLYTLSNEYPFDLESKGIIGKNYESQIKSFETRNPVTECRRVLETYKDYLVGMKTLLENKKETHDYSVNQAHVLIAAREYFEDYLIKNNINPLDIEDKKEREEVLNFLHNPVKAFTSKYKNEKQYFKRLADDEVSNEIYSFKKLEDAVNRINFERNKGFKEIFEEKMASYSKGTSNANKNVAQIIDSRKGGFLERKFDKTSKEYKALVGCVKSMISTKEGNYGAFKMAKMYAERYVERKKRECNDNFERLSTNERGRIDFCKAVIKTYGDLNVIWNAKVEDIEKTKEQKNQEYENKFLDTKLKRSILREEKLKNQKDYANLDEVKIQKNNKIQEFQENLKLDLNEDKLNKSVDEINNEEPVAENDLNKSF